MSLLSRWTDQPKRERLIRCAQTLQHYLLKYFSITNRLLEILNTQLDQSEFPTVSANEQESIEENCARLRDVLQKIIDVSETEDKHVRKSIDPAVYEQISAAGVSLKDRAALMKDLHQKTLGLLGNTLAPVVTVRLVNSDVRSVMPPVEHTALVPVQHLTLADLTQGSEEISRLLCRPENSGDNLDEAAELVEEAISVLKPPCDMYEDIVCELKAYVSIVSENM